MLRKPTTQQNIDFDHPFTIMQIIKKKQLTPEEEDELDGLWDLTYPKSLNGRYPLLLDGVVNYLHYLIKNEDGQLLGWLVSFEKDDELRFSIIVRPGKQRMGIGHLLISQLKSDVSECYGWVIDHNSALKADGTFYQTPIGFYLMQGFEILPEQRIETDLISCVKVKWRSEQDAGI